MYVTNPRGPTSRLELTIDWAYPGTGAPEVQKARQESRSVRERKALPAEEAFALIAGDDPRPLLVLRECLTCTGTDDALLTRQVDNEKTLLLSRWFHCVKLPPDVLDEDHPFHELFAGEAPAHLFVAGRDGSERRDLTGAQSRTELWTVLEERLAEDYSKKPDPSLKQLLRLLDEYDSVDRQIAALESRVDELIEEQGPKSSKVKKAKKELTSLHQERSDLRAKATKVSDLRLKKPRTAQAHAPPRRRA